MTYGLVLMFDASHGQDPKTVYRQNIESVKLAESGGFSTLWLTEHHGKSNRLCPSIPLMMSYLAGHTKLELGAATILLSHYKPRHIAEKIGMLTHMYPNRFAFGFAKGGNGEVELHDNGDEYAARKAMIEHLDELRTLMDLKSESFPTPSYKPPMFIASKDDSAIRYAAKHGMGIMAGQKWTLDELKDTIERYKIHRKDGKKPEVLLSRYLLITKTDDEAVQKVIQDTAKRKAKNNKPTQDSKNPLRISVLEDESPVGSFKKAEKLFRLYREIGVDRLALRQATFDVNETMASIAKASLLI